MRQLCADVVRVRGCDRTIQQYERHGSCATVLLYSARSVPRRGMFTLVFSGRETASRKTDQIDKTASRKCRSRLGFDMKRSNPDTKKIVKVTLVSVPYFRPVF